MAGERILVVDDSQHVRMSVRGVLEPAGYIVEEAIDGAEGLQKAIDLQPDLMLLDLTMPELDGFEVLQFMGRRPETSGIKVIMLTGSSEQANQQYGYTLGVVGYVVKPVSAEALLDLVGRTLRPTPSPWG